MNMPSPPSVSASQDAADLCRVLIVDDSVVIRGWIRRALESQGGFKIVGAAANGQLAVDTLRTTPADVVILDIEMPVMDGLTAIPLLKEIDPATQIVMASTLTRKNAEVSLKAMALGATDYIPKPNALSESNLTGADEFARELVDKVRMLGALAKRRGVRTSALSSRVTAKPIVAAVSGNKKPVTLRSMPRIKPEVIAIGSSTGGPQALFDVIKAMGAKLSQPIVITQHMPPSFTAILAEHISRQCDVTCVEAKDDDLLKPGHYYVAPGDFHMIFVKKPEGIAVKLNKDAPENFCRPSVDPMMRSLNEIYKGKILAVILTGMGQDGLKGSQGIVDAGGVVVAQDEATSVVWGMPGAVANAGLCSAVLPLGEMGSAVRKWSMGTGL